MILAATFTTIIALLIVPFFLIINGIIMIKREGRSVAHMLSLGLGIVVLIGETLAIYNAAFYTFTVGFERVQAYLSSDSFLVQALIITTVIYGSMSFVIFMIYSVFLMIIPRKKDFDYVIIHGAGLLQGEKIKVHSSCDKQLSRLQGAQILPPGGP